MWARSPIRKRLGLRKVTGERRSPRGQAKPVFPEDAIVDAPEHYEYARGMGLLTWGTWDTEVRPLQERLKDFLQAFPPDGPARFQGSMLAKTPGGEYGPAQQGTRLERLESIENSFGVLAEVLARYGLKRRTGPEYIPRKVDVAPFREATRARNQRLRVLHGRVDIEAENMDEAKIAEIERREKKQAAEQIRAALQRAREDGMTREDSDAKTER